MSPLLPLTYNAARDFELALESITTLLNHPNYTQLITQDVTGAARSLQGSLNTLKGANTSLKRITTIAEIINACLDT